MRYIIVLSILLSLSACSSDASKPIDTKTAAAVMPAPKTTVPISKVDPVCEMPYDKAWTDQTIYKGDTVIFCSEVCKKTFLARPKKYMKG